MKYPFLVAGTLMLTSISAYANSSTVEDALKNREELSMFYQALINSGVAAELESGTSYTVFAPTNEAFAKISKERYPCFYTPDCKAEVADIVRNHIFEGNYSTSDITRGALPNLDHQMVNVINTTRNTYYIGGQKLEDTHTLLGGMLYEIDGVIADDAEMMRVEMRRVNTPETAKEMITENAGDMDTVAGENAEQLPLTAAPAR